MFLTDSLRRCSVRENIEFGVGSGLDPDMEEEDRIQLVERAAERAQLLDTVQQMPNGFNTMLGDRSEENLSDGTMPACLPPGGLLVCITQ